MERAIIERRSISLAVAALFLSQALHAEESRLFIEEVVVTAQKREENLQSVPIAITALSDRDLEIRGITSIEGVAQAAPSITVAPFPTQASTLIIFLRGQGDGNPWQVNSEGAVGLYQDGFFIARPNAATFDMADIERVEVLRGPQGTLYGKNTTGGAVNIISKKPAEEFGFKQDLMFGSRDQFRSLTTIDTGEIHGVSTKFTLLKSSIDGYVHNTGSSHDYGEQSQLGGKLQVAWKPLENLQVDYFAEMITIQETPIYYQNASLNGLIVDGALYTHTNDPASHTWRAIDLDEGESDFEGHGLTVSMDFGPHMTIKSLTGYRELDSLLYSDFASAQATAPGVALTTRGVGLIQTHQFSQELQLIGDNRVGSLQYILGLYYFTEAGSGDGDTDIPTFGLNIFNRTVAESTSKAVFGQLSWRPDILDRRVEFILGGRYTKDFRQAERFGSRNGIVTARGFESGAGDRLHFDNFNPMFSANFQWTEDILTYFTVATAYRSGGIYADTPTEAFDQASFDPEEVVSYELGMKSYLFDRLRFNVAAYNVDYKDKQTIVPYPPGPTLPRGGSLLGNAGKATIRGLEFELLANLSDDLTFSLDYAYLDANLDEFNVPAGSVYDQATNPISPYRAGENINDLFTMIQSPENSATATIDYIFLTSENSRWTAHFDYRWRDEYDVVPPAFPNSELGRFPSYGVMNARIMAEIDLPKGDKATVSVWGNNILNREYPQAIMPFKVGLFPSEGGVYSVAKSWASPPTYGISLSYRY